MGNNENCPDDKDGYNADELIDSNFPEQGDSIDEIIDWQTHPQSREADKRIRPRASAQPDGAYPTVGSLGRSRVMKPSEFESGKTESPSPRSNDTLPCPTPPPEALTALPVPKPNTDPVAVSPTQLSTAKSSSFPESKASDQSSRVSDDDSTEILDATVSRTAPKSAESRASAESVEIGLPKIRLSLPNGSEGKHFEAELFVDIPLEYGDNLSLTDLAFEFEALEQLGIKVNIERHKLIFAGTPTQHGEFKIAFNYVIPRRTQVARPALSQSEKIDWFVNPDPRSLWKDLTPDPSLPYPKPATDRARVQGSSVVIAASVRGRSHAHEGTFRDDDFCVWHEPSSDWYLMIVCDGAGSAKYSRRGSELTCEIFRREIQPFLKSSLSDERFNAAAKDYFLNLKTDQTQTIRRKLYEALGGSAMKAFKSIQSEAKTIAGGETKLFATTIVSTISKRFSWGWFVGAFSIGDGGAAIYREDGEVRVLNRSDGGEFAGQTRFLTMPEIWTSGQEVMDRIHFAVSDRLTAVIAMTDGVSDPKFETDDGFKNTETWHRFWQDIGREVTLSKDNANADKELLNWLNFWSPGNHDDRTLAILLP